MARGDTFAAVSSPSGLSQDAIRRHLELEEIAKLEAPVRQVLVEELGSILRSLASEEPMTHDELLALQARTRSAFAFASAVDRARKGLALEGAA